MSLWAIIPVKPLRRSKSRLADVLTEDERAGLNQKMLENTLQVLIKMKSIQEVLVVSRDTQALAIARNIGAKTMQEVGEPGLNISLKRSVSVAKAYSAQSILVLPADLPFIASEDVELLISKLVTKPMLVIAPDRHMNGTNALLINPPDLIEFSYGPGSFERHVRQAQKKSARIEVVQFGSSGISLDIDLPEDLDLYLKTQASQLNK